MSHTGTTGALWVPIYWFIPWNFTNYLEEEEHCLQASLNIICINECYSLRIRCSIVKGCVSS